MTTPITLLTHDFASILGGAHSPFLSLYQPTHRHRPDNLQDPIRFRNLVKELEQSLAEKHRADDVIRLLEPFHALAADAEFWNHTLDGLAVFAAPDFFHVFTTQRPVAALAIVAESFHTKPLWGLLQSDDRYQVLGLSREGVRLLEGSRDALDEVDLASGVPRTLTEALGEEKTEPHQTVASYGGTGAGSHAMRHGHGGNADEVDKDTERFFRAVDRAVLEHHSRPTGLPLILAALAEHHHRFHDVSQNPFLLTEGITVNPDAVTTDALRTLAWQVVEPRHKAWLAKVTDDFEQARGTGRGSDNLPQITAAAASGRVATLFIEADHQIAGHLDEGTGKVIGDVLNNPPADDVLDDLGDLVSKMGGEVLVIPAARMPTRTGVAAIYRY